METSKRITKSLIIFLLLLPIVWGDVVRPITTEIDPWFHSALSGNNTWTGNNIFYNFTAYNLTFLNQNTNYITYNVTSINFNTTSITGNDLTGGDGDLDRTYNIGKLSIVIVDNFALHPTIDYNYSSSLLTFKKPIWNDQIIDLYTTDVIIAITNKLGSDFTLTDGSINRVLMINGNVYMLAVDNYVLHLGTDYVKFAGGIRLLKPLWNDQVITIWTY